MELNNELLDLIKELDIQNKISEENSKKIDSGEYVSPSDSVFNSLTLLNKIYELEPILEVRHLHYSYIDSLNEENYVSCQHIVDKLKKINR